MKVCRIIRSETTQYTYINFVIFVVKHFIFINICERKKVLKKPITTDSQHLALVSATILFYPFFFFSYCFF